MKNRGEPVLPTEYKHSGGIAPHGARSRSYDLAKVTLSLPARAAAPVPKSERTIAHEAPGMRLTCDSATMPKKKGKTMKEWTSITHYAGFDWARDHHAVVVVNQQGQIVADFEFAHT